MTQSQWTAAAMFAGALLLAGSAWRFYAEGFTWVRAALVVMTLLMLANVWRHRAPHKS